MEMKILNKKVKDVIKIAKYGVFIAPAVVVD